MKKLILSACILMFASSLSFAQTGLGARFLYGFDNDGYAGVEVSMQKAFKWELDMGWFEGDTWRATFLKEFRLLTLGESFGGVYGGIGASGGYNGEAEEGFGTVAGDIGIFIFLGNFQLGLDYRPELAIINKPEEEFISTSGISVRYMLGGKPSLTGKKK